MFALASSLEVTSELKTILAPWLKWGQICHLATPNEHRVEEGNDTTWSESHLCGWFWIERLAGNGQRCNILLEVIGWI